MASLKDMRVRIAATKATQKITKAMQMVAASKLRRAQAAAEAARPYAEHMTKVLGNIAAAVGDLGSVPPLLRGRDLRNHRLEAREEQRADIERTLGIEVRDLLGDRLRVGNADGPH